MHHGGAFRALIRDEALASAVLEDWRQAALSDRQRALCAYAEKLTREPAAMHEEDLLPLRGPGLDDRDILDLVQVIAYFNYVNRVADGLGVELEESSCSP